MTMESKSGHSASQTFLSITHSLSHTSHTYLLLKESSARNLIVLEQEVPQQLLQTLVGNLNLKKDLSDKNTLV